LKWESGSGKAETAEGGKLGRLEAQKLEVRRWNGEVKQRTEERLEKVRSWEGERFRIRSAVLVEYFRLLNQNC
jgi:hypothetical protein